MASRSPALRTIVLAALLDVALLAPRGEAMDASTLLRTGRGLAVQGRFAAAAALFQKAATLDTSSPEPELLLGDTLRDAGYAFLDDALFDAALGAYRRASARSAGGFDAPFRQAVLLYEGGSYDEAILLLEKLEGHPGAAAAPLLASYLRAARWHRLAGQAGGADPQRDAAVRRCHSCWLPLDEAHWTLESGRLICDRCFGEALTDDAGLAPVVAEASAALEAALGLRLRRAPAARLVSRVEIERLTRDSLDTFEGVTGELAGLYTQEGREPTIYVLRGLPRRMAVETVAHELAHAWEAENCPPGTPLGVTEGVAEFAAYTALRQMGLPEAADRLFLERGPYGVHFKRLEVLARVHGRQRLLEMVREGMP